MIDLNELPTPARVRHGPDATELLRDPALIRARCAAVSDAVSRGRSAHFKVDRSRLADLAARVEQVARAAWPDLNVPAVGFWQALSAGQVDRASELGAALAGLNPVEQARSRIDLTVVGALLGAGAGSRWRYSEAETEAGNGQALGGSEGLAVATYRAFRRGAFSAVPGEPMRVDASALRSLDATTLAALLQAGPANPMAGLEGRAALLQRLGEALQRRATQHGTSARPAAVFDTLTDAGARREATATAVFATLLDTFAAIWRTGSVLHGVALGDVWPHRWAGGEDPMAGRHGTTAGWVPFHLPTQWLAYSLVEPFAHAGVAVTGLDALTALPEARHGGLLIDGGVIVPRDAQALARTWAVSDEFVIEWRALTVTLIDELAPLVRLQLGRDAQELPLAAVLACTRATGHQLARELRDGRSPITIDSDGTVF